MVDLNKLMLQDIEVFVKDAIVDFEYCSLLYWIAHRNFCEVDRDFIIEEAQDVVAEVQSLWPENIDWFQVRVVLAEGGHVLRYHKDIEESPPEGPPSLIVAIRMSGAASKPLNTSKDSEETMD
ncbi:hypothetical protein EAF00_010588 [Botryotinia globosa]|nr:hypothetical protein EAF00_010588 [Botryotinia globosa]